MKRPLRKEVDLLMADVRHPQSQNVKKSPVGKFGNKPTKQNVVWAIWVIVITLVVAIFVLDLGGGARGVYQKFKELAFSIKNFDAQTDYIGILESLESELGGLDRKARLLSAIPKLKEIPEIISGLREVVSTIQDLSGDLEQIGSNGLRLSFNGEGEQLIAILTSMESKLAHLRETSEMLLTKSRELGVEGEEIDFVSDELSKAQESISNLVGFLNTETPRRIVLLFENPSELRPNGGFAGSYGELTLEKGSVTNLQVQDIYYPDKFLPLKVIPPRELQTVTPNWGARDTGWFFDFAKSAENLLYYLEASDIYADEQIQFDGVIAINIKVIEDLLRVTGPIEIPEYELVLDHKNFLSELQREVEANKVPGENPKKVLSFAAPRLIEALGKSGQGSSSILEIFASRARNKDIQMFFKEDNMQNMVREWRLDGGVYELFNGFVGDYLALVNTNVAGGKTDIFVKQDVSLRSEVEDSGQIKNNLTITRWHKGQNESDPWYNHLNQNFFRVFAPQGSRLLSAEGGEAKEIVPQLNYAQSTYATDQDIVEIESTIEELSLPGGYAQQRVEEGKRVFATWFNVEPGEQRRLEFQYYSNTITVRDGVDFTFVLDKQSGSEMDFEYAIVAPAGYYWQQSGSDLFRYRTNEIPARLELKLMLREVR